MPARPGRTSVYSRWMALGLTARIVAGLLIGLALGLFFGEAMRVLQPVADGYIRLNLACPRSILEQGLERICKALRRSP